MPRTGDWGLGTGDWEVCPIGSIWVRLWFHQSGSFPQHFFSILYRIDLGGTSASTWPRIASSCFSILYRIDLGGTPALAGSDRPLWRFSILYRIDLGGTRGAGRWRWRR